MLKVVGCFTQEHNLWLVALAACVCVVGCALTLRVYARLRRAPIGERLLHVALAGVLGGATIWTTHFVAMVAYDPVVDHAYEPVQTALSLFVAIAGVTGALALSAMADRGRLIETGGALLGLSIAAMHYLGMSAFQLPGHIEWDPELVAASILFGMAFSAMAINRVSRYSSAGAWISGVALLTLAICLMHFTGMGAISMELDSAMPTPEKLLSDSTLIVLVVAVTSLFLLVGFVAYLIETRLERQADAEYRHATRHDALTGLPNRLHLRSKLEELFSFCETMEDFHVAVLTLDLDRFKEINDLHGRVTGDVMLKSLTRRMSKHLFEGEFVARNGGDEFVAVKYGYSRRSEVEAFAARLTAQLVKPVPIGAVELSVSVSVGVAAFPEHGSTIEALMNNSDLALHRAKEHQHESVCFFDAEMDRQNRDRVELTRDLREALSNNQFELYFQRQNDVRTRALVGFEALLRWNHPERGRVSPAEFIPLAEETGLIRPIGVWVLRAACREAASWAAPLRIAVNVAPQQIAEPSFVEQVADALMESGLDPCRLELEITEASIIDDHKNTLKVMHCLKEMGVRIAMDDFGTGYSSLASLRAFPFDKIKIDRSFVDGVHLNAQSSAIVRSTLLLGGALQIPVLAEGVETEDELNFLGVEQCAEVQGFLFGRPLPAAEAREIASVEAAAQGGRASA